jgi:hypothetical protein
MWFPQKGNLWILTKGPLQNVIIEHYSYRGGKPSSVYKEETPYKKDDYSQFQKPASPIDEKTLNDGEYVHSYPLVCHNVIFQRVLGVGGREEKILVGGIYIGAWLGRYELGLIFFPEKEKFWSSYENLNGVLKNRKYLITRKVGSEIYQAEFTVLEINDSKSAAKVEVVLRAQSSDSGQSSHGSSQVQKTEEFPVVGEKVKEKTQEIEEKRTEEQKTEELERNAAWRQKIHGLYREAQELIFKKDYESASGNYQQILGQDCEACGYKKYDICRKIAGIYSFYKAHEEGMTFSDLDQIEKWNRKALGYNPPGIDADGIYDQLKWAYIYRGDKEGIAKLFDGWANAVPSKRDAIMKEKERTLKNWEWYLRVYSSKIK